jgi:hypothetical protein
MQLCSRTKAKQSEGNWLKIEVVFVDLLDDSKRERCKAVEVSTGVETIYH